MSLKVVPSVKKLFVLERSDKELGNEGEPTTIEVKTASQGAVETRNRVFQAYQRVLDVDGNITVNQNFTYDDVRRKQVFLTLTACNIQNSNGDPLFHFENGVLKSEDEFIKAWNLLDPIVAEEIHEKVLEQNPIWDPTRGETQS